MLLLQSTARNRVILMVATSDHVTGLAGLTLTITASKDGAAFASITPTVTDLGSGYYNLALTTTHANTLGDFAMHITGAAADPTDVIDQVVLFNFNGAALTAAQIATGIWQDTTAGDFTTALSVGKSVMNGVALGTGLTIASVSGAVGSVTGAVGSVTGAVGSVTGSVGSVTGAVGSVTARVTANTDQLAGQTVTAAAGVTFPTSVASPTNITAGTITTVTNLTNAATAGDFTATMKTSLNAATPASVVGAVGSVTGNVGGNVVGSVGSVSGAVGSVTGNVNGNVVGSVASVTAGVTVTTNNDKTGYRLDATGSAALTESYAADGATATLPQLLYGVKALLGEFSISGTTLTTKKLDGSTSAEIFTLNDATTPTSITRTG